LYPGLAFVDGFYTIGDLPDSIVITINGSQYTLSRTGVDIFDAIYSGSGGGFVIEIYSGWRVYLDPGEENEQFFDFDCLISDLFTPGDGATASVTKTEDQFADTYTVSYGAISFVNGGILERTDLCTWSTGPCEWLGSFSTGWSATIFYGDPNDFEIYRYKWRIVFSEPFPPLIVEDDDGNLVLIEEAGCSGAGVFLKDGNQNTPVGSYDSGDPIVS
jgi:hypothetical protein